MPQLKGTLTTVTRDPSSAVEVWVTADKRRTGAGGAVVLPEKTRVPVQHGEFSVTMEPGPAVLIVMHTGYRGETIPLIVTEDQTTIAEAMATADMADGRDADELLALVQEIRAAFSESTSHTAEAKALVDKAGGYATRAETAAGTATTKASAAGSSATTAGKAATTATTASSTATNAASTATAKADEADQFARDAKAAFDKVSTAADNVTWTGDRVTIMGKQSPSLTGPQGERGPRGPQGDTGPRGVQGEPGPKGDTGDRGPQGQTGPRGAQGEQGKTGPRGPAGADGTMTFEDLTTAQRESLRGPAGADGKPGPAGERGPQGQRGPRGYTGDPGPAGTTTWAGISDKPSKFPPATHKHKSDDIVDATEPWEQAPNSLVKTDRTGDLVVPSPISQYSAVNYGTILDEIGAVSRATGDRLSYLPDSLALVKLRRGQIDTVVGIGVGPGVKNSKDLPSSEYTDSATIGTLPAGFRYVFLNTAYEEKVYSTKEAATNKDYSFEIPLFGGGGPPYTTGRFIYPQDSKTYFNTNVYSSNITDSDTYLILGYRTK